MSNLLALIKLRIIYEIEIFLGLIKLNIFSDEEIGKFLVKKKNEIENYTEMVCQHSR